MSYKVKASKISDRMCEVSVIKDNVELVCINVGFGFQVVHPLPEGNCIITCNPNGEIFTTISELNFTYTINAIAGFDESVCFVDTIDHAIKKAVRLMNNDAPETPANHPF